MDEIVKIHNDLSNMRLKKMSAKELDLLMAICVKVKNQHDNLVDIDYVALQKLSNYKQYNISDLKSDLEKMNEHLVKNFVVSYTDDDGARVTESLFKQFRRYDDYLQVRISDKLLYLLNDLTNNFTAFELQEFTSLSSKYSKRLYKLLKQYKTTGIYFTYKEQFYMDMDIPDTYSNTNFNRQILRPAIAECAKYFKDLTVVANKKSGGKKIKDYTFTFAVAPTEPTTEEPTERATTKPKSNKFNDFDNKQDYNITELESRLLSN